MPKLGDVLADWAAYELDDEVYVPDGSMPPTLDTEVRVYSFDRNRRRESEGATYLLGFEQVRDVISALESELGRPITPSERLRAALHYAEHDAFIDADEIDPL